MRLTGHSIPSITALLMSTSYRLILFVLLVLASTPCAIANEKPNVIVVLTDDQGWADLSVQGQLADIRTPHIDELAQHGIQCTAGYVTAPQCSPSRAGLMTGVYQQRFGIDTIPDMPLPTEAVTLAERLKPLGYRTGFVGKWHLEPNPTCIDWMKRELPNMAALPRRQVRIPWNKIQPYSPTAQGFDEYYWGELNTYRINYELDSDELLPAMKVVRNKGYRLDIQTEAALKFIDRNHTEPFYLHIGYYGPHTPLQATEEYLNRFKDPMPLRRRYALAMLSAIDDGIGRIVAKLEQHGIRDNTLIVFTSDNGAPLKITKPDAPVDRDPGGWDGSLNDPWVGEKGMLAEGGVRVPMIWSLPSKLPQAVKFAHPISTLDIAPTVLELSGGDLAAKSSSFAFDGVNVLPAFLGCEDLSDRSLYFRFWDQAAVRRGRWKYLYVGAGLEYLFDLQGDEHETQNRLSDHPEIAGELKQQLNHWSQGLRPPGLPKGEKRREQKWYEHYFGADYNFVSKMNKPKVWIITDMSDKTLEGDNHIGTINDPDDISAMVGYLLMANEFDTQGIVVASTHRSRHQKTPDQADWASRYFDDAYQQAIIPLNKTLGGYPTKLSFQQSSIKETAEHFDPSKEYVQLDHLGSVQSLLTATQELPDNDVLNVLCWGSVTEPAILVRHCQSTGKEKLLSRLRFIAHWTNSTLHQGTPEQPEQVANCREDLAACRFLKSLAAQGKVQYYECGAIGQHGIVGGAPTGKDYYDQFRVSRLGELFVDGKFVRGCVDHSDSATYWTLLGEWGVSLSDISRDGSNPTRVELANEDKFRENSQRIHDELLRRAKIAGKAN